MAKTLIRGGYVISMDEMRGTLPSGDVMIEGESIVAVGSRLTPDGAEVVDATNRIVLPGFVDTHRHMHQSILRGCGGSAGFTEVFRTVSQGYGSHFSPEDTYASARLGLAEAIDSGVTTIHAWEQNIETPAHADAGIQALLESGIRARFSYGAPSAPVSKPGSVQGPETIDLVDILRARSQFFTVQERGLYLTGDRRIHLGIACRNATATPPEVWQKEFAFARKEGLPITVHVSGGTIATYERSQALGTDVLAIHAYNASEEEIWYLAASGAPVSVSPTSLMRLGIGRSPIVEMMRAGICVCLSTDSAIAGDTVDMFSVMRTSIGIERSTYRDATVYTPEQALRQATIDGAIALGLGETTGSLTPGKRADLILIRADDLNMAPLNVAQAQLVFAAQPRNVEVVYIDGICRKRGGELVGVDTASLVRAAKDAVAGLGKRLGQPIV